MIAAERGGLVIASDQGTTLTARRKGLEPGCVSTYLAVGISMRELSKVLKGCVRERVAHDG